MPKFQNAKIKRNIVLGIITIEEPLKTFACKILIIVYILKLSISWDLDHVNKTKFAKFIRTDTFQKQNKAKEMWWIGTFH